MTIDKFTGKYRFLSNSYPTPIRYEGVVHRSVEHAFQASKTTDSKLRNIFRQCTTVAEAKEYGDIIEIREDWEDVKDRIMYELVKQKFENTELRNKLIATGDSTLINNDTDENHLGKILMRIREEIKGE